MSNATSVSLENYFKPFREHIIGNNCVFESIEGQKTVLYADWIASGRLYGPIEDTMRNTIGPMIANTHSFSSETGKVSTYSYQHARQIIKEHVHANENDVLVCSGTGMTGVLSRLQRIMGLKYPDALEDKEAILPEERPVVFISHMEHHSNQVPWQETIADVVIVPCDDNMLVSAELLEIEIEKYKDRPFLIGAFTACSNVTGIITPYHALAKVMHAYGGTCLIDFAASAPYVDIDMHPENSDEHLDAVLFSPHKFLGGPGSCGVLVFNKKLYNASCPDVPGGGNVKWTNPWGEYTYYDALEVKEDGGTPGFLQVMRAALAIRLKEKMTPSAIAKREEQLLAQCFTELEKIPGLFILGVTDVKRIGCVSFGVKEIHYNLLVRLLNDRFGIQLRGGWSCASTYAHHLFEIDKKGSDEIVAGITSKNLTNKPGWVRISLHPCLADNELQFICDSIKEVVQNITEWQKPYTYNPVSNEFETKEGDAKIKASIESWFKMTS